MGGYGLPFFCLAVGAIRKDARGVAVAVAAAETVSEAACLSRFALWYAIIPAGPKPDRAPGILHCGQESSQPGPCAASTGHPLITHSMTTAICLAATLLALLTIPLAIVLWATESPQQRARRWHRSGQSYRAIGQRLGISHTTARRWCVA